MSALLSSLAALVALHLMAISAVFWGWVRPAVQETLLHATRGAGETVAAVAKHDMPKDTVVRTLQGRVEHALGEGGGDKEEVSREGSAAQYLNTIFMLNVSMIAMAILALVLALGASRGTLRAWSVFGLFIFSAANAFVKAVAMQDATLPLMSADATSRAALKEAWNDVRKTCFKYDDGACVMTTAGERVKEDSS